MPPFFPYCPSLPLNQSVSVGKMLIQFIKCNRDPGLGFVLGVRDFPQRGRLWNFQYYFTFFSSLLNHHNSFWTFKIFSPRCFLFPLGSTQWIPPSWSSHKAINTFYRGLEASGDYNKNTMDYIFLVFSSLCTSKIPFLLADAGLRRFPHFQEGPFQKEQRQLESSSLGLFMGGTGIGMWVCESAGLWAAAPWASELCDTEDNREEEGRNWIFGNRHKSPLKSDFGNERRLRWTGEVEWTGVWLGGSRECGAAWSPCRSVPSGWRPGKHLSEKNPSRKMVFREWWVLLFISTDGMN